jgi:hypothetical protein
VVVKPGFSRNATVGFAVVGQVGKKREDSLPPNLKQYRSLRNRSSTTALGEAVAGRQSFFA